MRLRKKKAYTLTQLRWVFFPRENSSPRKVTCLLRAALGTRQSPSLPLLQTLASFSLKTSCSPSTTLERSATATRERQSPSPCLSPSLSDSLSLSLSFAAQAVGRFVFQGAIILPSWCLGISLYLCRVSGLRLSDGSLVHFDMLLEDEQFVDALNKRLNSNNLATPRPVFVPADPAAASALGNAASPASTAAAASGFSLRTESTNASGASASEAGAAAEPPQAAAPSSGPCRLVLSPACLVNRSLFLSDVAFVKLVDALEKEAHSRGGSEASVSSDDAIKLALHDLGLGLHALVVRQVHAVRTPVGLSRASVAPRWAEAALPREAAGRLSSHTNGAALV